MVIYFFTDRNCMYICTAYVWYGTDIWGVKPMYSFKNYHQVKRRPTLAEAKFIYEIIDRPSSLCGTCDSEPELITE